MSAHAQFFALAAKYPVLAHLWDTKRECFDIEQADRISGKLSTGELVVLNCLRSIWNGYAVSTNHRIDFTDLAALDPETRKPLIEWLLNPVFP